MNNIGNTAIFGNKVAIIATSVMAIGLFCLIAVFG